MSGVCTKCNGRIIFTISEGSIKKYLEPALDLANNFNIPEYTKYGLPISLVVLIGDINLNINYKVKTMIDFLLTGEFKDDEKYKKGWSFKNYEDVKFSISSTRDHRLVVDVTGSEDELFVLLLATFDDHPEILEYLKNTIELCELYIG